MWYSIYNENGKAVIVTTDKDRLLYDEDWDCIAVFRDAKMARIFVMGWNAYQEEN